MLAQHYGANIVPWFFCYEGIDSAVGANCKPLRLLLRRLTAPLGTIHCRRGRSSDLKLPQDSRDRDGFSCAVQQYYREQQESG